MSHVVTREKALSERHYYKLPNGTETWVSSCVGVNSVERRAKGLPPRAPEAFPPPLEPIAFLVEQAAHSSIPATTIRQINSKYSCLAKESFGSSQSKG